MENLGGGAIRARSEGFYDVQRWGIQVKDMWWFFDQTPSWPYTLQRNGMVEQANQTIVQIVQMIHAQLLNHDVMYNVVYLRNRCPTKAMKGKTPEEAWSRRMLHISHMCMSGCMAYTKVSDQRQQSLMQKAWSICFLDIAKALRCIGSFVWRWRKSSRV